MPYPAKTTPSAVLDAALAIVSTQGWTALSMRTLALALNVRASSIYHHFADRAAIENALGALTAQRLLLALQSAAGRLKGSNRTRAIAHAYLDFSQSNAALFHLIATPSAATILTTFFDGRIALRCFLHGFVTLPAAERIDLDLALGPLLAGAA